MILKINYFPNKQIKMANSSISNQKRFFSNDDNNFYKKLLIKNLLKQIKNKKNFNLDNDSNNSIGGLILNNHYNYIRNLLNNYNNLKFTYNYNLDKKI